MSAPNTNVEKEKQRHKPAIFGIKAVMVYAAVLLLGLVLWTFYQSDGVEGADQQIDGRTGEVVEGE